MGKDIETNDHDLLVILNTKFDALSMSVAKMNDGIRDRIRQTEIKIEALETIVDKVDPIVTYQRFLKVEQQVGYIKFTLYLIGIFAFILSWTTGFVNDIINIFKK